MGSRVVLKNCLLIGTLVFGAAAGPARATADDSSGARTAAAQGAPGLMDRVLELFHRLRVDAKEPMEPAASQPDRLASLTPEQREQMRDQIRQQWHSASPEERQKRREEFRERWEAVSPEQREQIRDRSRDRWEQLTPEQRLQIRQHIEDRSGRPGSAGGYGPGPGR